MVVSVVVAVACGGVVRGFFVRMAIIVGVTVLFIVCFGAVIVAVAFGVGAAAFHFLVGIGFGGFGLAAREEQGGESEGCEYFLH